MTKKNNKYSDEQIIENCKDLQNKDFHEKVGCLFSPKLFVCKFLKAFVVIFVFTCDGLQYNKMESIIF